MKSIKEVSEQIKTEMFLKAKQDQWNTGYENLDQVIGGFCPGEVIFIGGRPGMGSEDFILNLVIEQAKNGKQVIFYSFQKSYKLLFFSLLSILSGIDRHTLIYKEHAQELEDKIVRSIKVLEEFNLSIQTNITEIDAIERQLNSDFSNLDNSIIIIDRFQLLTEYIESNSIYMEEPSIIIHLKNLALDLHIPILIHTSLRKEIDMRGGDKKPSTYDLLGSENNEEVADKILLLWRPQHYGFLEDEDGNSLEKKLFVIVDKNSHGETTQLDLTYDIGSKKIV